MYGVLVEKALQSRDLGHAAQKHGACVSFAPFSLCSLGCRLC